MMDRTERRVVAGNPKALPGTGLLSGGDSHASAGHACGTELSRLGASGSSTTGLGTIGLGRVRGTRERTWRVRAGGVRIGHVRARGMQIGLPGRGVSKGKHVLGRGKSGLGRYGED